MPVNIRFTGEESDLIRSQERVGRSADRLRESTGGIVEETRALDRVSRQAYERVQRATDEYSRTLEELNTRLRQGRINQQEFSRAAQEAQNRLNVATRNAEKSVEEQSRAVRDARREMQEFGRAGRRVFEQTRTPAERLNRTLEELRRLQRAGAIDAETLGRAAQQAQDRYQRELNETEAATERAFGDDQIRGYIEGFVSLTAIITGIREIMEQVNEEAREAADVLRELAPARGELAQVATSPEDFQQLLQLVDRVRTAGVGVQPGEAEQVVFAARSTGLEDQLQTFLQVGSSGLARDIQGLINSVDTVVKAFGDQAIPSVEELVSQSLVASGVTQNTITDLLEALASVGASARARGVGDEEAFATIATLAGPTGSAALAATQVNAFLSAAEKAGIEAGSLAEQIAEVQRRMEEQGVTERDILGSRKEALTGFRTIVNSQQQLRSVLEEINAQRGLTDGSLLDERTSLAASDPTLATFSSEQIARGRQIVSERALGLVRQQQEVILNELDTLETELGTNAFSRAIGRIVGRFGVNFVPGNDALGPGAADVLRDRLREAGRDDLIERVNELVRLQAEANRLQQQANQVQAAPQVPTTVQEN